MNTKSAPASLLPWLTASTSLYLREGTGTFPSCFSIFWLIDPRYCKDSPLTAIASVSCSRPYFVPSKPGQSRLLGPSHVSPPFRPIMATIVSVIFWLKIHSLGKTDIQCLPVPKSPIVRLTMKSVSCCLYISLTHWSKENVDQTCKNRCVQLAGRGLSLCLECLRRASTLQRKTTAAAQNSKCTWGSRSKQHYLVLQIGEGVKPGLPSCVMSASIP